MRMPPSTPRLRISSSRSGLSLTSQWAAYCWPCSYLQAPVCACGVAMRVSCGGMGHLSNIGQAEDGRRTDAGRAGRRQAGRPVTWHGMHPSSHPASHPGTHPPSHPSSHPPTQPPSQPPTHPPTHPATHPATQPATQPARHPPQDLQILLVRHRQVGGRGHPLVDALNHLVVPL